LADPELVHRQRCRAGGRLARVFELDSLVQLSKTLDEVREYFNPALSLLGYLFTMSEPTINTAASLQILRQTYTEKVLKTVIPRNTDLRDAHFNKQDIFSFNARAKAALAYDKLIRELFLPEASVAEHPINDYEETA
jgi:chromosome partitioning protein